MAGKPRILTDHKDMLWSLIPLVVICLVIAVVSGNCSVGLTGSASDDRTPPYDIAAGLTADAQALPFPVRLPATPQGWKPNSGSRSTADGRPVSNVGYITADGVYIQLSQTDADEGSLVGALDAGRPIGAGVTPVAGRDWVRYTADNGQSIWIANLGDVRIGLYSKGSETDFRTLATAVLSARVLPRAADRPVPVG